VKTIRYLLDENVDPLFRTELLRHQPEMIVWRIGDPTTPPRGSPDPDILRWCEANLFILVTNNRKSMPQHLQTHLAAGRHMPGIFELSPNMSIGEIIEELILIWFVSDIDEYRDKLLYLPLL
jgi:hypothetical protein